MNPLDDYHLRMLISKRKKNIVLFVLIFSIIFGYFLWLGIAMFINSIIDNFFLTVGSSSLFCLLLLLFEIIIFIKLNNKYKKDKSLWEDSNDFNMAINYEKAMRYDDAIKQYEKIGNWDDAGRLRQILEKKQEKEKHNSLKQEIITKHIHIQVNDLFSQIRNEGLTIPYQCPNCKGTLKITGKKIDTCPYCGSQLDLETLSVLVKTMLE